MQNTLYTNKQMELHPEISEQFRSYFLHKSGIELIKYTSIYEEAVFMSYEDNIPEFALKPAKEPENTEDGFDPTPYDRLLYGEGKDSSPSINDIIETATECTQPEEETQVPVCIPETKTTDTDAGNDILYNKEPEDIKEPPEPDKKKETVKIIPLSQDTSFSKLKITDVKDKMPEKVYIEEDILVPDVKPDLLSVLAMDASVKISEKEIQAGKTGEESLSAEGEVLLQTVYLPEKSETEEPMITIRSSIPFKTDWMVNVEPYAQIGIQPKIERVDYTVINERKLRVKIAVTLNMKEYKGVELDIFEDIKGEEVQILKEDITITDIAASKRDIVDIRETMPFKESGIIPEKILKYDINITENHRQITDEKVVINAAAICSILYLAKMQTEEPAETVPKLYRGRCEFTQFIPLEKIDNCVGSKVSFEEKDLKIRISNDNDAQEGFVLEGAVVTSLDVYKNVTKGVVSDIYHNSKDITYDMAEIKGRVLKGSSLTDINVRETVVSQETEIADVIYISGMVKNAAGRLEKGRASVEGILTVKLLCMPAENTEKPFSITKEIEFKSNVDIPAVQENMDITVTASIRELWFDVINEKQVEVRGDVLVTSEVVQSIRLKLMKNLCFIESEEPAKKGPSMILYVTQKGDCLWDIAKKYRTTVERLRLINDIESDNIEEGKKLLVVR